MTAVVVRRAGAVLAAALLAALLAAVPAGAQVDDGTYEADIRWTEYGIPHITADDLGSLGFGNGYAAARDNLCVIAEDVVTVNAQRSRFFGADEVANVTSDVFNGYLLQRGDTERLLANGPEGSPPGPTPDAREQMRGFSAGYNAYLRQVGVDGISDPACSGAAWVRTIDELDLWRRAYATALRASSAAFAESIVAAVPPGPGAQKGAPPPPVGEQTDRQPDVGGSLGSNAYGLGADATESGNGIVLGNPHFPWDGPNRFWQSHQTIPGELDVQGAALIGFPGVQIGFTDDVAWSHTVSTGQRFAIYRLQLGSSPTTYVVDGQERAMTPRRVQVDGSPGATVWETEFGPLVVLPDLGLNWTEDAAYALVDANDDNLRGNDTWLAMNRASSVRELAAAIEEHQGIPWVNTTAADSTGEAMYAQYSVTVNVPDEQARRCIPGEQLQGVWQASGLTVLDGSRSECLVGDDPDAVDDGIFGPDNLPVLFTDDYVTQSNDSHWLSNPDEPLEGFARVIGDERTQRSLRTRLGLRMVEQRLAGTDSLPGDRFDVSRVKDVMFNNRNLGGELLADDLEGLCRANPTAESSDGQTVELAEACEALEGWDRQADLTSRGAHLFREFARAAGLVFADDFDVDDPIATPSELAVDDPAVLTALADAVAKLRADGIPLDAQLGDLQTEERNGEAIPIHGGPGDIGVFNALYADYAGPEGYPDVRTGASFIMAVELADDGPVGSTVLTYSQSTDPTSPHYGDQTRLYSDKEWVDVLWDEAEVEANTIERATVTSSAPAVERVAGDDRFATSVAVSRRAFDASEVAVLARGDVYADALVGAALGHPLLLTQRDEVPAGVLEELQRLGVAEVLLLGSEQAITSGVASALEQAGYTVTRAAGADRYATAAAVATERFDAEDVDRVFLVRGIGEGGRGWADAASAGWYASQVGAPVLLAAPEALPDATLAALDAYPDAEVTIVGGPPAVPTSIEEQLDGDGRTVTRLAGNDRYATSVAVYEAAIDGEADPEVTWVATGENFPDSLTAGAAAGALGQTFLLVDGRAPGGASQESVAALGDAQPQRVLVAGGRPAVDAYVAEALRRLLE